jgi:hypothetical protein
MPTEAWSKLNLPERTHRKIKSNAAMAGLSMVQYISGLVKKDEKARAGSPNTSPELPPVKEVTKCQP